MTEQFEPKVRELEWDWPYGNLAMLRSFLNEAFNKGQAAAYRNAAEHVRYVTLDSVFSAECHNGYSYCKDEVVRWLESQAKQLEGK